MEVGDDQHADDVWQNDLMAAIQAVAEEIKKKNSTNPWPTQPTLDWAMTYLMTELWDRGFTTPEIQRAFKSALDALPPYAADER